MKHLWIQYGYDNPEMAPVYQTADTEEEAREDDDSFGKGVPWYRYDIVPGNKDGKLINPEGPFYFSQR